jgi:hypothetical protein
MATNAAVLDDEARLPAYIAAGERTASRLDNRGPIRFAADGRLHPDIVAAYDEVGLYIFEGVIGPEELAELRAGVGDLLERLPVARDATVDAQGRPAHGANFRAPFVLWSKPLGDPLGGTSIAGGRHAVKMFEPTPAADLPAEVPFSLVGPLQFSDAALRTYGHPELLRVAAAINGEGFVPFNEAVIVKKPGQGASFAWHQDGMTHWQHPDWDAGTHGFNFMVQLYGSTAANGLWFVPGSHRTGKVDLKAMIGRTGQLLPDAVPLICKPGDVAISNRQIIHGSFPNMSGELRVTLNMGFHRRSAVENVSTHSMHGEPQTYDDAWISERAALIGYGISARRQRFPDETPFVYRPLADAGERHEWNEAARAAIREYHRLDILI